MSTGMLVAIEMVLIIGGVLAFAIYQLVSVRRSLARDRESQQQLQAGSVPTAAASPTSPTSPTSPASPAAPSGAGGATAASPLPAMQDRQRPS